jgi:hypothetical protein
VERPAGRPSPELVVAEADRRRRATAAGEARRWSWHPPRTSRLPLGLGDDTRGRRRDPTMTPGRRRGGYRLWQESITKKRR